ncbi:MAG TPA: hypothetical protein VIU61_15330, partial [Kofleriaceae bacterium]
MKLALVLTLVVTASVAGAKGLTVDDMLKFQRVSDPVVSPDARWIAFVVRDTDFAGNRGRTDLWLASSDGQTVRRLTSHPENDSDPQWARDGKWLYFVSARSGSSQVWRIAPAGGEAEQVTRLDTDLNGYKLFPDGKRLILAIDVWPDAKSIADSIAKDEAKAKSKVKARVYDQLLFRHWDQWEDGKYSHLFLWTPPELGGKANDAKDLTPGQATDSPTHPFGGMEEVSIAPDQKTIAFVARTGGREMAWRTNTEVFTVGVAGGKPAVLTKNPAYDFTPTYSPDGKWIAVNMMVRAGFEADRQRIGLYDVATRKLRVLTEAWDRSATTITWSADGKTIYTSADH